MLQIPSAVFYFIYFNCVPLSVSGTVYFYFLVLINYCSHFVYCCFFNTLLVFSNCSPWSADFRVRFSTDQWLFPFYSTVFLVIFNTAQSISTFLYVLVFFIYCSPFFQYLSYTVQYYSAIVHLISTIFLVHSSIAQWLIALILLCLLHISILLSYCSPYFTLSYTL